MVYEDDAPLRDTTDVTYSDTLEVRRNSLTWLTHVTGALMSFALIGGVAFWGYKLVQRDVEGIPVVRAMDGEMRVRPEDPGGDLAQHQGLAVNEVAAEGGASAPANALRLAPQPVRLTEEDVPLDAQAVAMVQQAIVEQVTSSAETGAASQPMEEVAEGPQARDAQHGLQTSIRPRVRPDVAQVVQIAMRQPASAASARDLGLVDPASLPVGTRLVQLGAFESADIATAEWAKLSAQFSDLMVQKRPLVQQASSGGRAFYRLRAVGFEDRSVARRFCAALVAEGSDCIPVITR